MKKLAKILATVMAISTVATTMVMPITADAAATYGTPFVERKFNLESDMTAMLNTSGTLSIVTGIGDKDPDDKVLKMKAPTLRTSKGGYTVTSGYVTYESELYMPKGTTVCFGSYQSAKWNNTRSYIRIFADGTIVYNVYDQALNPDRPKYWTGYTATTKWSFDQWHRIAIQWDVVNGIQTFFVDDNIIGELHDLTLKGNVVADEISFSENSGGAHYCDNFRVYDGKYEPSVNAVKPVKPVPSLTIDGNYVAVDTLTYDALKADLMSNQTSENVEFAVYSDFVGGTAVKDVKPGYVAAVISKNADYYYAYDILAPLLVDSVVFDGTKIVGTFSNLGSTTVESMTMIFVEKNAQDVVTKVYASNTQTGLGNGTYEFEIDGFTSMPKGDIFFIDDWSNMGPALDYLQPLK